MASFDHNKSILLLPPLLFIITVLLIVSLSLSSTAAAAAATRDTITPTQPLADNETLVSAPLGTFALGFFTPTSADGRRRYVGVWYNHNVTVQPILWVANRANPVIGLTGQLSVTANGTITITNRETSTNSRLTNPVLQLLDTGNFVLREEGTDDSQNYYAWQSFDYPTDTLLPGMKLAFDKVAAGGLSSRNLTAWKSDQDDPSPGDYCAAMGTVNIPEMYLFDRSTTTNKIWRSGPWDGIQLGGIRNMIGTVTYSFVNNVEEVAFSYQASGNIIPILKISQDGSIQLLIWISTAQLWNILWLAPKDECENIGKCGSYGFCDGNQSPTCSCLPGFTPKIPAKYALRAGVLKLFG